MDGPLWAARYSALPGQSRPVDDPLARLAPRKPYTRRRPDRAQIVRFGFQAAFVLLNLWIGARFYFWVRYYETGGATAAVARPPGVEGWLPIAALMNLKYVLFGLFFYAVASMSAADLRAFLESPYGLVADVKMLDFFRTMGQTGALVVGGLLVASLVVKNVWCRYLCPYGALLGLVSLVSPTRIRRDSDACIDCAKCAAACPALLPVDRLTAVRSAECTACLACVAVCPSAGALDLVAGRRRRVPGWAVGAAIAALFLAAVGVARLAGVWHTTLPDAILFDLIPRAREFTHP